MTELRTRLEYLKAHIRLWDFLMKHPELDKQNWKEFYTSLGCPYWLWRGTGITAGCFLCALAKREHPRGINRCDRCILGTHEGACDVDGSLYSRWYEGHSPKLAKQIRDVVKAALIEAVKKRRRAVDFVDRIIAAEGF